MRDRALSHLAHAVVWILDRIERATGVHDDDLEAIIRATAETTERTPIYDAVHSSIVRTEADTRRERYGDEDVAEWDRELAYTDTETDQ